jgi:spore coat polysaccharide biosynthesis protein SpsF
VGGGGVIEASLFEFSPERQWDFVFTSGLLIHINPDLLQAAYKLMAGVSARYVCMVEYYNPEPMTIPYRGHTEKLFKRDFAGEFLDAYPEYKLNGYGFEYRRDPVSSGDDSTWFLLERV